MHKGGESPIVLEVGEILSETGYSCLSFVMQVLFIVRRKSKRLSSNTYLQILLSKEEIRTSQNDACINRQDLV